MVVSLQRCTRDHVRENRPSQSMRSGERNAISLKTSCDMESSRRRYRADVAYDETALE
jgi:hypothetical protein